MLSVLSYVRGLQLQMYVRYTVCCTPRTCGMAICGGKVQCFVEAWSCSSRGCAVAVRDQPRLPDSGSWNNSKVLERHLWAQQVGRCAPWYTLSCLYLGVVQVLKYTALSADLKSEEPIDVVCHESYPDNATLWDHYSLVKFVPFNPVDKFTMAIVKDNASGSVFRVLKGAPQV